jgi:hypothetical protein
MAKLLKIVGQIIGISLEWMWFLLLFLAFAIHTSPFQTFLTKKITHYLSSELGTEIKIDKVSVVFIDKIAIDGFLIKDQKKDTLAFLSTLFITLDDIFTQDQFIINKVEIDRSVFKLNRDKQTGDYNYWFLTDYFAKPKKKQSKALAIHLKEIQLRNVRLDYDDHRKYYSDFGMDYDHLKVRDINLDIRNMKIEKDTYSGHITNLRASEKCGFQLKKFSGFATVSPKGVYVDNVILKSSLSKVYAKKINLVMNHFQDFYSFEDSVSFDAVLDYSKVSMEEISYFAPILEGMNQMVYLKADVTKKIENLKIANLNLKTGEKTKIIGHLTLPDFRHFDQAFFNEKLKYAYVSLNDLQQIKLPKRAKTEFLQFDKYLERLKYFEGKNVHMDGFYQQFVIAADHLKTGLGDFELSNGILFTENKGNKSYFFERSEASQYDVKVDKFQLGEFLQNKDLGVVHGTFFLSGEAVSFANIRFNDIEGEINQFDYLDYAYKNIILEKGKLINNIFEAKIDIKDDNLHLKYEGFIDFKGKQHMVVEVDLGQAILDNLNISRVDNAKLKSKFTLNLLGNKANDISGEIVLDGFVYSEGNKQFDIPDLKININRTPSKDVLKIQSQIANLNISGKVDFNTIIFDLEQQVSKLFPAIIPPKKDNYKKRIARTINNFDYQLEVKNSKNILDLFFPDLQVAPGTKINGFYHGDTEEAAMTINSKSVQFQNLLFLGVHLEQQMDATTISGEYAINHFSLNDSINVQELSYRIQGDKELLHSEISWNLGSPNESIIQWNTAVLGIDKFNITLLPSFFNLKQKKWNLVNESGITVDGSAIGVGNFLLEREKQYLSLDGRISRSSVDQLNFRVNDFRLDDFGGLFGTNIDLKGLVNGWGYLSNPYENLKYIADANIQDLFIDKREIGNIFIQTQWDQGDENFDITGDLIFKGQKTFGFEGDYFTNSSGENLDFNLNFDNTDIQFLNTFMDPDLLKDIRGFLVGKLKVKGSLAAPALEGDIELVNGNANLAIVNVNYGLNGKIMADKYGFYINNMPIRDEEGNTASLVGSVYHENFSDWNFDLAFNLEDSGLRSKIAPGYVQPLDRFLVLNTTYSEGEVYYGKGYATGMVDVSGYLDNIDINLNLKTEKGSKIFFPMYGFTEISEESSFITYLSKKDTTPVKKDPKIDFTGVEMKLNFKVTPDAEIKIILDENTGDEITSTGFGNITVALNNLNDLTLDGTYKINDGGYHFVLRPIEKNFIIEKGGTVTWTGDPYNALINLQCYFPVNASLNEIAPSQNVSTSATGTQMVKCYINLTESLMKPTILFDITAPNSNESGKAMLESIKKSNDMLNKQFFSLLIHGKFQRIDGQTNVGGSNAALDVIAGQINGMLTELSKNYDVNVALGTNNTTGGTSAKVGIKREFLDSRLVLTGSVGVGNTGTSITQNKNTLIGDVNLEYLLNAAGTFKVNIFNESNQNSILQNKLGLFTQGVGIQYHEEFQTLEGFKLYQYFKDLFRSKQNKQFPIKRKKKHNPVPEANSVGIISWKKPSFWTAEAVYQSRSL